jgi:hypothetical protein
LQPVRKKIKKTAEPENTAVSLVMNFNLRNGKKVKTFPGI